MLERIVHKIPKSSWKKDLELFTLGSPRIVRNIKKRVVENPNSYRNSLNVFSLVNENSWNNMGDDQADMKTRK